MELYTPKFGKLQKRREADIDAISKERKKTRDANNALMRKSLGKSQSAGGFTTGPDMTGFASQLDSYVNRLEESKSHPLEVISVTSKEPLRDDDLTSTMDTYSPQEGNTRDTGTDAMKHINYGQVYGTTDTEGLAVTMGELTTIEQQQRAKADSAVSAITQNRGAAMIAPAGHPGMGNGTYSHQGAAYQGFYTPTNDNRARGENSINAAAQVTKATKSGRFGTGSVAGNRLGNEGSSSAGYNSSAVFDGSDANQFMAGVTSGGVGTTLGGEHAQHGQRGTDLLSLL
jgi:hypothetical protein